MANHTPAEPTPEQCSAGARVADVDGYPAYACWYPQMGGYVGKCVVSPDENGSCFEAWVWHDGDFPFGEGEGRVRHLHHCDPDQFRRFADFVTGKQGVV